MMTNWRVRVRTCVCVVVFWIVTYADFEGVFLPCMVSKSQLLGISLRQIQGVKWGCRNIYVESYSFHFEAPTIATALIKATRPGLNWYLALGERKEKWSIFNEGMAEKISGLS